MKKKEKKNKSGKQKKSKEILTKMDQEKNNL